VEVPDTCLSARRLADTAAARTAVSNECMAMS
jgi:hypothetical protein